MTTPLKLLTLPREIRDRIYDYLFQELPPRFLATSRKDILSLRIYLRMDYGPILNVLLVHSRMHSEYLEAACFKHMSVTVLASIAFALATPFDLTEEVIVAFGRSNQLAKAILRRTAHLTIYQFDTAGTPTPIFTIKDTLDLLGSETDALRSVRVATRKNAGRLIYLPTYHFGEFPQMLPTAPIATILGFPLVQHGTCFGLRYDLSRPSSNGLDHLVDCISFEAYAKSKKEARLWGVEVAEEPVPPRYPERILGSLSEERVSRFKGLHDRAFNWSAEETF